MAASSRYNAPISRRDNEFLGDMTIWEQENSEDNSEQLARLRRPPNALIYALTASSQFPLNDKYGIISNFFFHFSPLSLWNLQRI